MKPLPKSSERKTQKDYRLKLELAKPYGVK